MREISYPASAPFHCAAIPSVGQSSLGVRWVHTGSTLGNGFDDVYLSDVGVQAAMAVLGFPTPAEFEQVLRERSDLESERDDLLERVDRLEQELEEERRVTNAIDVLESRDFTTRRKRGPKAKEVA